MNGQVNEKMRVELGIWPIFLPFIWAGSALWTVGTAAVAALPTIATAAGSLMAVNSLVSMFNQPKAESVSIPGAEAARGLSPEVATALRRQQTELERLQQEELKRREELKSVETQVAIKQKTENFLSKYGLFLVAGGAVLITVLAIRKKRKK